MFDFAKKSGFRLKSLSWFVENDFYVFLVWSVYRRFFVLQSFTTLVLFYLFLSIFPFSVSSSHFHSVVSICPVIFVSVPLVFGFYWVQPELEIFSVLIRYTTCLRYLFNPCFTMRSMTYTGIIIHQLNFRVPYRGILNLIPFKMSVFLFTNTNFQSEIVIYYVPSLK